MVGGVGIAPTTFCVSSRCSPTELTAPAPPSIISGRPALVKAGPACSAPLPIRVESMEATPAHARRGPVSAGAGTPALLSPKEHVGLALVRPLLWRDDETCPYRIAADVFPFFGVRFCAAHQMIKELRLPREGGQGQLANLSLCPALPSPHEAGEILHCLRGWRGEEMNMIGHDHVTPDHPAMDRQGLPPGAGEDLEYRGIGEHRRAVPYTNCQEEQWSAADIEDLVESPKVLPAL